MLLRRERKARVRHLGGAESAGRLGACRYFFNYELPKIGAWLRVVNTRDQTCAELPEDAF